MVFSNSARRDVEKELLTKEIIYRAYPNLSVDLTSEEFDNTLVEQYYDYKIKAQCTIQSFDVSRLSEGTVINADLVGLFAYKYTYDVEGMAINPDLIPKTRDEIYFLGQWYVIKACTPATSEDDGIIGWDFAAVQVTKNNTFNIEQKW